jgi:hypothetical protein
VPIIKDNKMIRCQTIFDHMQAENQTLALFIQKLAASKNEVEADCSFRDVLYQARMNYEMSNLFYQTWIKNSKLYSGLGYNAKCSSTIKAACVISGNSKTFSTAEKKVTIDEERC